MAQANNISLRINLRSNTNQKSDFYGHLYPYLDRVQTLSMRGFCKHMAEHGTMFDRATITGVMTTMQTCLVELLSQGVAVKLDGIGTFYPTVESIKSGAATLAAAEAMGPDALVAGVHIRFLPDGTELDNITSREMKKNCSLRFHQQQVVTGTKTVTTAGGKTRKVNIYKYLPIGQPEADQNPGD